MSTLKWPFLCVCVCVRERERERDTLRQPSKSIVSLYISVFCAPMCVCRVRQPSTMALYTSDRPKTDPYEEDTFKRYEVIFATASQWSVVFYQLSLILSLCYVMQEIYASRFLVALIKFVLCYDGLGHVCMYGCVKNEKMFITEFKNLLRDHCC